MEEPDGKAEFLAKSRPFASSRSKYNDWLAEDRECPPLLAKVQGFDAQVAALRKDRDSSQPVDERHTRKKQLLKGIHDRIAAIANQVEDVTEKHAEAINAC